MAKKKTIAISGAFDPLHAGHIQLFKDAAEYGDVVVILNSDDWIIRKKGHFFMSWEWRKALIEELPYVEEVFPVKDMNDTVCSALKKIKPDFFGNGGSRKKSNVPKAEIQTCENLDITMIWKLGDSASQGRCVFPAMQKSMKEYIRLLKKYEEIEDAPL